MPRLILVSIIPLICGGNIYKLRKHRGVTVPTPTPCENDPFGKLQDGNEKQNVRNASNLNIELI
mgnify:CR=1 FL=1